MLPATSSPLPAPRSMPYALCSMLSRFMASQHSGILVLSGVEVSAALRPAPCSSLPAPRSLPYALCSLPLTFTSMIAIDDVLLSDDIVTKSFVCDLDACKGACCWEGEWGAPLRPEEPDIIKSVWKKVSPYLTEESREAVRQQGYSTTFGEEAVLGTPLIKNGACAYLIWDGKGIGKCAFEKAFEDGKTDWPKPISCHLYPIRVRYLKNGTEAWNYDKWKICAPACKLGKKLQVPVYKFLKNAIIRAKGKKFFKQLEACAEGVE